MEVLERIPTDLDESEIAQKLHIQRTGNRDEFQTLLKAARTWIDGKALYKVSYIEEKLADGVVIDGNFFRSRVLRRNLGDVGRVFPYVVSLGSTFEERAGEADDVLEKYYLDRIGNIALVKARHHVENHLKTRFALDGLSFMSPGSLNDWPIEEQKPLFALLGDVEALIGVKLSESLLMVPRKSVSGIYFPTKVTFFNCQLCPRLNCEGRKAKYDEELARDYGLVE
jgi:hypothetical protein